MISSICLLRVVISKGWILNCSSARAANMKNDGNSMKILITDYVFPNLDPEKKALELTDFELVIAPDGSEETLTELAGDVDGILTCFAKVTDKVIENAINLKVIARYGVGVDNIAVNKATELGIAVTYVPDYCVDEVADHVFSFLLAWNRQVINFDYNTKMKGWGSVDLNLPMNRLRGSTIGVIGFGRIGRNVAEKAKAFGMHVLVTDPFVTADLINNDIDVVPIKDLLEKSDFVTIHSPLNNETKGMISVNEFRIMKKNCFIINCARGPLIDEAALISALESGEIAGAGLDVLESDHPENNNKLFKMNNVIVSPHVAFYSPESTVELQSRAAGSISDVLSGKMPDNLYNKEVVGKTRAKI